MKPFSSYLRAIIGCHHNVNLSIDLVQLNRFIVVELTHPCSNLRFDINIIFTNNFSFNERCISVNNESFLITNFMNLKIKSTQFFKDDHMSRICVSVFIELRTHTYMNIYIYTIFLRKRGHWRVKLQRIRTQTHL
jgi:hypothetical protein